MMMPQPRYPHVFLLLILCSLLAPASLLAQGYPPGGDQSAQQPLVQARSQLQTAQANVDRLTAKAKDKLATQPEWTRAQKAIDDARRHLDAVREETLSTVKSSAEYKDLQLQQARAEQQVQQLRDAQQFGSREFASAANQAFDARFKLKDMERKALEQSEQVRQADTNLAQAQTELDNQWDQYVQTVLVKDQTWTDAVQARDAAADRVKQAEAQFTAIRQQQAVAASASIPRQTRTRSSSYSSGSRSGNRSSSRGNRSYGY